MSDPTEKCAGYCHDWDTNWCDEVEDAEEPDLEEEEDEEDDSPPFFSSLVDIRGLSGTFHV